VAANRVTTEAAEVAVVRDAVPGKARVTAEAAEVAMLKNVVPGGAARVTAGAVEVALWLGVESSAGMRARGYIIS
jgi:hypothetical protein